MPTKLTSDDVLGLANPVKGVVDSIAQIKEIKNRREAEQNYKLLTAEQKKNLDKQIANAQSENERVVIITKSLLSIQTKQMEDLKKRSQTNQYILIGAAIVLLFTLIVIKKTT